MQCGLVLCRILSMLSFLINTVPESVFVHVCSDLHLAFDPTEPRHSRSCCVNVLSNTLGHSIIGTNNKTITSKRNSKFVTASVDRWLCAVNNWEPPWPALSNPGATPAKTCWILQGWPPSKGIIALAKECVPKLPLIVLVHVPIDNGRHSQSPHHQVCILTLIKKPTRLCYAAPTFGTYTVPGRGVVVGIHMEGRCHGRWAQHGSCGRC